MFFKDFLHNTTDILIETNNSAEAVNLKETCRMWSPYMKPKTRGKLRRVRAAVIPTNHQQIQCWDLTAAPAWHHPLHNEPDQASTLWRLRVRRLSWSAIAHRTLRGSTKQAAVAKHLLLGSIIRLLGCTSSRNLSSLLFLLSTLSK